MDPRMFAPADLVGAYSRGLQVRQQNEEAQGRRRLGDLLPQVVNGQQSPQRDAAMAEIAQIDPRLFMQLDERQKAQASAELDDLSAAVRWADTPEKWAQVQQYYTRQGHDVSGYPFEARESALISLGKIGEYLKGAQQPNQPSSVREYEYARGQGFKGTYMDFQNQMGSPIMVDNGDGTKTLYPRAMLGGGQQQQGSVPPPPPGFQMDGGPTPPASGGFPR